MDKEKKRLKKQIPEIARIIIVFMIIGVICIINNKIMSTRDRLCADEIVTFYRASNLYKMEKIFDWLNPSDGIGEIFSGSDFTRQISVSTEESIVRNESILGIIKMLITQRQYFLFLNIAETASDGVFSLERVYTLNTILLCMVLLTIFYLCQKLYGYVYGIISLLFAGMSWGILNCFGYVRFYILVVLYALLLVCIFFWLDHKDLVMIKQIVLCLTALVITWFGFKNSEYMAVFYFSVFIAYCALEVIRKRMDKAIIAFATSVPIWVVALFVMMPNIILRIKNGIDYGHEADQLKVAFINLTSRPMSTFLSYFKAYYEYIRDFVSAPDVTRALIVIILLYLLEDKKRIMVNYFTLMLCGAMIIYQLIMAKIAPYMAIRYDYCWFFVGIIVLTGLLNGINVDKTRKYIVVGLLILGCHFYVKHGIPGAVGYLEDGASINDREYLQENYNETSNVYYYGGDVGTLLYGAFLWPSDSKFYLTTVDDFESESTKRDEILAENGELLVWIDYSADQELINKQLQSEGFIYDDLVFDTGESGRHYIYKYVKK